MTPAAEDLGGLGAPIRVMYVVPDLGVGGAERHVASLMPGLDRDRFVPSVVCLGEPGALFGDVLDAGVPAIALRRRRRQAVRTVRELVGVMRRDGPDVVITRGYNAEVLGRVASLIARVPHRVVWVHHHAVTDDRPFARRVADRLLDRWTDAYFGVAQAQIPFLVDTRGHSARKVHIIRNGTYSPDARSRHTASQDTGSPDTASGGIESGAPTRRVPVMGTVSAMRPEKDHPTFLAAAARVAAAVPDLRVLVVGDGPERERAQRCADELGIADRTDFVGLRSDVPAMLDRMDVFVLSSDSVECFPMALLEAMAAGLPAVCTDVGGVGEMVIDGVTGHLVPPHDPAALADRVIGVLSDGAYARSLGDAARARARTEFSRSRMIERTEDALTRIATADAAVDDPVTVTVVMDLTFVGGAETLLLSLAGRLDRSRVCLRIVCLRAGGPLADDFRAVGVPVDVLDGRPSRDPRRITDLAAHLRATGTDVVLVAHHHRAALAVGRLAATVLRIPTVVAAHDMDLAAVGGRVLPKWCVATLAGVSALVLLSRAQGDYLHRDEGVGRGRLTRTRQVVIGNGIAIRDAVTDADRARARRLLAADDDDVVIGIVARLSDQKAHETLFAAFEKCLADRPDALLVVVGGGDREERLRADAAARGIAARTRFLGVRRDVPDLLPGFDVACLSSVHEGVPLTLMEAMAAGVPVVATNCGSVTDVVTDGADGFVVEVGDHGAFADRLIALAGDADRRSRMGATARTTATARFDIEETARGYTDLLTELASGRSSSPKAGLQTPIT